MSYSKLLKEIMYDEDNISYRKLYNEVSHPESMKKHHEMLDL